jgi:vanillate O-demethylase ferredoxin subunit
MDADAVLAGAAADTHLYVCGPNPFMEHLLERARARGWGEHRLHREYFAADTASHADNVAFEIQLASSGRILEVPADRSALEVLLEHDIDIPFACEEGICGTCATRVLAGEPEHRDLFMTPEEHAANEEFAPCCSRARSQRLVLDI